MEGPDDMPSPATKDDHKSPANQKEGHTSVKMEGPDDMPSPATKDDHKSPANPKEGHFIDKGSSQHHHGSAIRNKLHKLAPHHVDPKPQSVFQKLAGTYQLEGKNKALLHGHLHVKIVRANNLRNFDCLRGCHKSRFVPACWGNEVSDAFVTVKAGPSRLFTTRTILNDLNPEWNEEFYVPVTHYVSGLLLQVQDRDMMVFSHSQSLGDVILPVEDLLEFDNEGNALRVGVHKVSPLDGKEHHGTLEYFVEYVPLALMGRRLETRCAYFHPRSGNDVKLYVNADDGNELSTTNVNYGGADDKAIVWEPQRLWRDIYQHICEAKHFIYVTGWSVDVTQSLLRGREREAAHKEGKYTPVIGDLFKQKAEEGVAVNMLVWDDTTSNFVMPGMMGTHDEEARRFFDKTKVTCTLAPMLGDEQNALSEKAGKVVMFTHHQKLVLLDAKRTDGTDGRELLGYIGGIDLTNGRWDNRNHPLFRSLTTDHKNDASNNCFAVDAANVGPREPWHDIHCSVRGEEVLDMIQNFTERWQKQAPRDMDKLVDLDSLGLADPPKRTDQNAWSTQLFRSIDSRTAVFDQDHLDAFEKSTVSQHFAQVAGITVRRSGGKGHRMRRAIDKMKSSKNAGSPDGEYVHKFVAKESAELEVNRDLLLKKGRHMDASAHIGMLHHIRRAEHHVYIENQYFLSSCHMWDESSDSNCRNLVAAELTIKICEKIEAGERFAAYILVPMWPEGIPESGAVQAILKWQHLTVESMYKRIAAALKRKRSEAKARGDEVPDYSPNDYLNFYSLVRRETKAHSRATKDPKPNSIEETLSRTRRHPIYIHSKMVLVDDEAVMIGSANINQRSLDGARDSEIMVGAWQPNHLATKESLPHGDVHGYRMHCWSTIMGEIKDAFREPSSLVCVHQVNEIAKRNWEMFTQNEPCEMDSHLVPFPVKVDPKSGTVTPLTANGCFPDTKAPILGTKSKVLPELLTT